MSPLRWTAKSTRTLSGELKRLGHEAGADLVGRLLHYLGYSLQANAKVTEGAQHPDRNAQFEYINATAGEHLKTGQPVISVDCKKKELVGADGPRRRQRHHRQDIRSGPGRDGALRRQPQRTVGLSSRPEPRPALSRRSGRALDATSQSS